MQEMKDNLDRKEFFLQEKEEIWGILEAELRKVLSKDHKLLKIVESETLIRPSNLA